LWPRSDGEAVYRFVFLQFFFLAAAARLCFFGTLFFTAADGTGFNVDHGNELWKATIEPSPPAATPATTVPAPATITKKKCKKKHGKKQAASAKKKKCKKKKK
jgi:hypothetical protein